MPRKFKPKAVPAQAHHLVQAIFEEMNVQKLTYKDLSERCGMNVKVFERWRKNTEPQLHMLDIVYKALNLKMRVERINNGT